jgi:DNA modification methylase
MIRSLQGDCRDILKTLPDQSVHCVVTSPPYWGLRDYGTATWDGGDPQCDHIRANGRNDVTAERLAERAELFGTGTGAGSKVHGIQFSAECGKCGATRIDSQIGLEPTPEAYVATMVEVFREVRRVLRKDGTLWLNLGDSYANTGNKGQDFSASKVGYGGAGRIVVGGQPIKEIPIGLKAKDLVGIPWRVAFALQADGWYLRQDIIWAKPNPMPESVTDRCTKAHEYIFLLSKSERYYYDAAAIAEPASEDSGWSKQRASGVNTWEYNNSGARIAVTGQSIESSTFGKSGTRNKRSVWTVTTQPFSEAHFATFPPALIEPCVMAGCPKGGIVLDPFGGAGTTGMVADRLQRDAIIIELNPDYAAMAELRLQDDAGMFAQIESGLL